MNMQPTGRLDCSAAIPELVFERQLAVPQEVAWAVLTESERTACWIGTWEGEAGPGRLVDVTWLAEEGTPTETVRILKCEPPRRLALATGPDKDAPWLITVELFDTESGVRPIGTGLQIRYDVPLSNRTTSTPVDGLGRSSGSAGVKVLPPSVLRFIRIAPLPWPSG